MQAIVTADCLVISSCEVSMTVHQSAQFQQKLDNHACDYFVFIYAFRRPKHLLLGALLDNNIHDIFVET